MLTREQADRLREEAETSATSIEQLAIRHNMLNALELDILETLKHPLEAAPGFEVVDLLGYGGMGVVYRAMQINLKRLVALKMVLISQVENESTLSRFENEARTVAQLRHPNIVTAYDFGCQTERMYFVMEYVEGEDAQELVERKGNLSAATALGIAKQTASGLAHASRHRIVHRDIKPANLLLVEPPEGFELAPGLPMVKIADFGLAALLPGQGDLTSRITQNHATVGSPHYMSPEQFTEKDLDQRADIYALGATIFHLISGVAPFAGKTLTQVIASKLKGETPRLRDKMPHIDDRIDQFTARLMSPDLKDRPQNYEEILVDINELLGVSTGSSTQLSSSQIEDADLGATQLLSPTAIKEAIHEQATATEITTHKTPLAAEVEEETESKTAHTVLRSKRPRVIALAVFITLIFVAVVIVWNNLGERDTTQPALRLKPTGYARDLFNGRDLTGWILPPGGNWYTGPVDGATVLIGARGYCRRPLIREDLNPPRPLVYYQFDFIVNVHEAASVELEFAIQQTESVDSDRISLKLTSTEATLGKRAGNDEPWEATGEPIALGKGTMHPLRIDRLPNEWRVWVDSDRIANIPITNDLLLPEFRLRSTGGEARFSDFIVQEFQVQKNQPEEVTK